MSKFTPGPWAVEKGRDRTHPHNITGDGFDLARCVDVNDARLIAAAPDLMEALRDAVSTMPADSPVKWVVWARAAIAKAEG